MTAEEAREIYHAARTKAMHEATEYSDPIVQDYCDLQAWKAVVEAIQRGVGWF